MICSARIRLLTHLIRKFIFTLIIVLTQSHLASIVVVYGSDNEKEFGRIELRKVFETKKHKTILVNY